MAERKFPCKNCGANLRFDPGESALTCPYCDTKNSIESEFDAVGEQDFEKALQQLASESNTQTTVITKCGGCNAEVILPDAIAATECGFCGAPLVKQTEHCNRIKPQSLLPFKITEKEGSAEFKKWITRLWFAPNRLKKFAQSKHSLKGVYLPHWTYDSQTTTQYTGKRGEYYYVTESYTTTDSEGKSVRKTRQVRKTRWRRANGTVYSNFDDVIVVASKSLPTEYVEKLEPWDLQSLVAYDESYLSGFVTESYTVDLDVGFKEAETAMVPVIEQRIRHDIGGDEQRIMGYNIFHNNITFKHILLPVWLSAYRFKNKTYRFIINARTGEVQGERPWSLAKIAGASIATITVIGGGIYWYLKAKGEL